MESLNRLKDAHDSEVQGEQASTTLTWARPGHPHCYLQFSPNLRTLPSRPRAQSWEVARCPASDLGLEHGPGGLLP